MNTEGLAYYEHSTLLLGLYTSDKLVIKTTAYNDKII